MAQQTAKVNKHKKVLYIQDADGLMDGSIPFNGKDDGDIPTPASLKIISNSRRAATDEKLKDGEIVKNPDRIRRLIQIKNQIAIKNDIAEFINQEILTNETLRESILSGKEAGHSIASHIDVETSRWLLGKGYPIKYEIDPKTQEKITRSFGDIWIKESGHYNPINIKTGLISSTGSGSSNMTSMNRLKDDFLSGNITAYYLAIIKFEVSETNEITPRVYFIDALNFIDYLSYNMGPGQIMMKEKELYKVLETNPGLTLTKEEKISKLKDLYTKGIEEGARKLKEMQDGLADFDAVLSTSAKHVCEEGSIICRCKVSNEPYSHVGKTIRHFQ